MRLTAEEDFRAGMLPLAQALLDEHVAFSILPAGAGPTKTHLRDYKSRADLTVQLLGLLERVAGLRLAPGTPLVYNTANWTGRPGAYTDNRPSDPSPSQLLSTMMARWHARSQGEPLFDRAVRATGFTLMTTDLQTTLAYVFDCLGCGLIGSPEGALVLCCLADAASTTDDPVQMANVLVPRLRPETSEADWPTADVGERVRLQQRRKSIDPGPIMETVVEFCYSEIVALRASRSLDEWCIRQARTLAVLRSSMAVIEASRIALPLSIKTLASQWEEVQADAFSFLLGLSTHPIDGDERLRTHQVMIEFTARSVEMAGRLRQQRVAAPTILSDPALITTPAWRTVSERLITPLLHIYPPDESVERDTLSLPGPTVGDDRRRPELEGLAQAIRSGDVAELEALAGRALRDLPWSTTLWWELGIARDQSGRPVEALAAILCALTLSPDEPGLWESFSLVLSRCGRPEEARLALVVAQAMSQARPHDGPTEPDE